MMKTVQELYDEIMSDQGLKAQAVEAAKAGKLEAFLKEHGCGATTEEVAAFLKEKAKEDAPLSLDEMDNAAAGKCNKKTAVEVCSSVFGILVVICAVVAAISTDDGYYNGQRKEGDGRLCNAEK